MNVPAKKDMEGNTPNKKPVRWNVFIPCFLVIGGAAILGIVNNEWLTAVTNQIFSWSLGSFGWLYQIIAMLTLVLVALLAFSKIGNIRFGGKKEGEEDVISACNPDSSYVGIEMDSACIAACTLGKMSERRNNRIIDESLSGYPWFCISKPGLNSGLMIPQYTQAGLLNEMRVLASPATIDNTPTCGNQEDYVAMGFFACKKAGQIAKKLEYILAMELLSDYQAQQFQDKDVEKCSVAKAIYEALSKQIPVMENDMLLYPHIEYLRDVIHSGEVLEITERQIGELQ